MHNSANLFKLCSTHVTELGRGWIGEEEIRRKDRRRDERGLKELKETPAHNFCLSGGFLTTELSRTPMNLVRVLKYFT